MHKKIYLILVVFLVAPLWAEKMSDLSLKEIHTCLSDIQVSLSNWNRKLAKTFVSSRSFEVESTKSSFRFEIQPFYQGVSSEVLLHFKKKRGRQFELLFSTREDEISRYQQLLISYQFLSDKMGFELLPVEINNKSYSVLLGDKSSVLLYPQETNTDEINPLLLIRLRSLGKISGRVLMSNRTLLFMHSLDFKKIDFLLGEKIP